MFNKKGYIGAIGDDLPSLIPIFLGITIFFAVFLNTYNVYRNNTELYSIRNDAISISGILKEDPLFADYNAFIKSCNKIKTKYQWSAFVIPLDLNTEEYRILTYSTLDSNQFITHWEQPSLPFLCGEDLETLKSVLGSNKEVTVFSYPITVQQKFYVEPSWLYVAIWR